MIEAVRIDSDEDGWTLAVSGDFVEETRRYLGDQDESELRLRLPQDAALALLAAAEAEIGPWRAEMREARAEYERTRDVDPADGYDPDDPKNPTWAERTADAADRLRKREREG